MQANFTYTYDFGNGNQCTGNTSLDVCSDVTSMEFDYSLCSTEQGYSGLSYQISTENHYYMVLLMIYFFLDKKEFINVSRNNDKTLH